MPCCAQRADGRRGEIIKDPVATTLITALAQAAYLVGCQATVAALVIDPGRDSEPYLRETDAQGMRIIAAAETHIHFTGDFVFVGDVGRPDLLEKAAGEAGTAEESARQS